MASMFEKCHAKVHFRLWFTFVTSTTQTTPTKRKRVWVTKRRLYLENELTTVSVWKQCEYNGPLAGQQASQGRE